MSGIVFYTAITNFAMIGWRRVFNFVSTHISRENWFWHATHVQPTRKRNKTKKPCLPNLKNPPSPKQLQINPKPKPTAPMLEGLRLQEELNKQLVSLQVTFLTLLFLRCFLTALEPPSKKSGAKKPPKDSKKKKKGKVSKPGKVKGIITRFRKSDFLTRS